MRSLLGFISIIISISSGSLAFTGTFDIRESLSSVTTVATSIRRKSFYAPSKSTPHQETRAMASVSASNGGGNHQEESIGQMLGGLVFLKTRMKANLVHFYKTQVGMSTWLEQPNITILSYGNMVLGLHESDDDPDIQGMYTFVYPSREKVDEMYHKFKNIADGCPRENKRYRIYQFFAKDPEGRNLEFQAFLHPLSVVTSKVPE